MASGWANDDAVNEQINNTIEDAVARARGELPTGESLYECEESHASRIKIHIAQHFQDIIAEVRKTASYVDLSLPKVSAHTISFTSTLFCTLCSKMCRCRFLCKAQ